jgi:primosomal protein N' (replication factor Y)
LSEKELIDFDEQITEKYREKTVDFLVPNFDINDGDYVFDMLNLLKRSKKQAEFVENFIAFLFENQTNEVSKLEFQKKYNYNSNIIKELEKKEIIRIEKQVVKRLKEFETDKTPKQLTDNQQNALEKIEKEFEVKNIVLLHGITSSGKTEIYIHLIFKALESGNVLFLVPEIGLSTQILERLKGIFGEKLLIYHSHIAENQRVEVYKEILKNEKNYVVIGTRSAVFLPFQSLEMIVIDEEHDNSYRQTEQSPRYNAKNAAGFLSQIFGSKILLGSATPSIETYSKAKFGKFGLVELNQRYSNVDLPDIQLIDLKESYRKKRMKGHFSLEMINKINETLAKNEQVILFQNRRGYSLNLECQECGTVQKCKRCDVSLTYHSRTNSLSCHYCGYTTQNYSKCGKCGSSPLSYKGFGTEQVEQEARTLFPQAKIGRLDLDTTRRKHSFETLIRSFEEQNLDIMAGTTMISKGLDFSNVGLVGIMNADNLMNFPDFRAYENAYQTLVQVSGRAGRKQNGSVLIQTYSPDNPIVTDVCNNSYEHFFSMQMAERNMFRYPPYCRLVQITIKHKESILTAEAAGCLAEILRQNPVFAVLGPDNPPVAKIQYMYLKRILLKIENSVPHKKVAQSLLQAIEQMKQIPEFKYVSVFFEVY